MKPNRLLAIILVLIIIANGVCITVYYQQNMPAGSPPVAAANAQTQTNAPLQLYSQTQTIAQPVSVHSSDGTMTLSMNVDSNKTGKTYSFSTTNLTTNATSQIFSKTVPLANSMMIPANAWSPDDKYIFIQQSENGITNNFVIKASGESFANNQQYLDVTALYAAKNISYSLLDVTGWASETLLVLKTSGPLYWFDIPSQSFIQLAR